MKRSFLRDIKSPAYSEQVQPPTSSISPSLTVTHIHTITPDLLRAARGLLDWTRTELAQAAQLSPETIKNVEHGTFRPSEPTCESLLQTFSRHNVEFFSLPFLNVRGVALITTKPTITTEAKESEDCQS